jgi:hypothetical membrane protein
MAKVGKMVMFTDRFPLMGPLVWILAGQYFAAQIVAAGVFRGGYSWRANVISDLGNTGCGEYYHRFVCSPDSGIMNASFILLGIIMALGSLLIYQEFRESRASLAGFGLLALGGLGAILVGVFPENTISGLHAIGAVLALGVANLSLIILALALRCVRASLRLYTLATGVVSLAAFFLYIFGIYFGLGQGGMERLASYPQSLWLMLFGLYMTASHLRRKKLGHGREQMLD